MARNFMEIPRFQSLPLGGYLLANLQLKNYFNFKSKARNQLVNVLSLASSFLKRAYQPYYTEYAIIELQQQVKFILIHWKKLWISFSIAACKTEGTLETSMGVPGSIFLWIINGPFVFASRKEWRLSFWSLDFFYCFCFWIGFYWSILLLRNGAKTAKLSEPHYKQDVNLFDCFLGGRAPRESARICRRWRRRRRRRRGLHLLRKFCLLLIVHQLFLFFQRSHH